MLLDLLAIAAGLTLLLYCGDMLVRGAIALAQRKNWPPLLIGMTIVAFGTSAPELFVSVHAALKGEGAEGIVLGNVVGSNIVNILLVLGIPAMIYPTLCDQPDVKRNTLFMVGASLIFLWFCFSGNGQITVWEGGFLFALIIAFLVFTFYENRRTKSKALSKEIAEFGTRSLSLSKIWLLIGGAVIGLPMGSYFVVEGAISLATDANISPAVIGVSIIAIGTSLPELATTIMAAKRRECSMALGNVLGSNLFNILAIMGISTLLARTPLTVDDRFLRIDLWVMLASALLIVPFIFGRLTIGRWSGAGFIAAYTAFATTLVLFVT
jgi:cation:H+ antiporter